MKPYSLRRRLLITISIPVILTSLLTIAIGLWSAWHEIEEVYDAQLAHSAKVLLQLMEHELEEDGDEESFQLTEEDPISQHKYEKNLGFRIWYKDKLITQATLAKLYTDLEAPPGFSDQIVNGQKWRFFVYIGSPDIRIETSERYSIRRELINKLIASLALPVLILVALVLYLVWRGIQKSMQPIIALSSEVDQRNSEDLSKIPTDQTPTEITPFVDAINRLFTRITDSFKREREFTDHAAHELRTPLAAMKTQAQVLLKTVKDSDHQEDLKHLLISINRAGHLVDQLLLLARLQNQKFPKNNVNLSACIFEALKGVSNQAKEKQITLISHIQEGLYIAGYYESLIMLFSNLLSNSIKYSPSNSEIHINIDSSGLFVLSDHGCGISDDDKIKIFQRFYRADKTNAPGSGLGLAIVKWIADAHNVDVQLRDNHPSGLTVSIQWHIKAPIKEL